MTNEFLTRKEQVLLTVPPTRSIQKSYTYAVSRATLARPPQSCGTSFKCTRFIGYECFREVEKVRANYEAFVTTRPLED